jgi:ABC transporter DrrB family efflux protein
MSSSFVTARGEGLFTSASQTLTLARRNLLHIKADPEQLVGMTVQPLLFLGLFICVFGRSVAGSNHDYLQYALPGVLVQTSAYIGFRTAWGINTDFERGLIDRFRSLPISRSAVVTGRITADAMRVVWGTFILTGFGLVLGFRFHGGLAGGIGAALLVTAFGASVCWPMALMGISAKSPESASTAVSMLLLPMTYLSSVFAPPDSMPTWVQGFVRVNPITQVVDAVRALMLGGPVAGPVLRAVAWMVGIVALFGPLTISRYQRRMQ